MLIMPPTSYRITVSPQKTVLLWAHGERATLRCIGRSRSPHVNVRLVPQILEERFITGQASAYSRKELFDSHTIRVLALHAPLRLLQQIFQRLQTLFRHAQSLALSLEAHAKS